MEVNKKEFLEAIELICNDPIERLEINWGDFLLNQMSPKEIQNLLKEKKKKYDKEFVKLFIDYKVECSTDIDKELDKIWKLIVEKKFIKWTNKFRWIKYIPIDSLFVKIAIVHYKALNYIWDNYLVQTQKLAIKIVYNL